MYSSIAAGLIVADAQSSTGQSTPQQKNFSDCGVFTCQTMEHRARGVGDQGESVTGSNPFDFQQENMPYMRMLMVWEIIHGALDERAHAS